MASDRQRRRRAKLARERAHAPRAGPAPARAVEMVREAFGRALAEEERTAPPTGGAASGGLRARAPALTVAEAAARLGVSPSTLYRRAAAGTLTLTRMLSGQLVVERHELARHAKGHRPARGGRPAVISDELLARIVALREQGMSLPKIGALLEREGVPTAHGGVRWWPSAVQAALRRAGVS